MARKADVRQVAKRRCWREADARVVVAGWHTSGAPLSGFAKRHGIAPPAAGCFRLLDISPEPATDGDRGDHENRLSL